MSGNYVINIGRQLGSGGKEIGEKLAVRLGINFYDKELINLASAPGRPRRWPSAWRPASSRRPSCGP